MGRGVCGFAFARRTPASSPSIPPARTTTSASSPPSTPEIDHRPRPPSLGYTPTRTRSPARTSGPRAVHGHLQSARAGPGDELARPQAGSAGWSTSPRCAGRRRRRTRFARENDGGRIAEDAGARDAGAVVRPHRLRRSVGGDRREPVIDELRVPTSRPEVAYRRGRRIEAFVAPIDLAHERPRATALEDGGSISSPADSAVSARSSRNTCCASITPGCCWSGRRRCLPLADLASLRMPHIAASRRDPARNSTPCARAPGARPTSCIARSTSATPAHCGRRWTKRETLWGQPLSGVFHLAGVGSLERHGQWLDQHWVRASPRHLRLDVPVEGPRHGGAVRGAEGAARRAGRRLLVGQRHLRRQHLQRLFGGQQRPRRACAAPVARPPIRAPTVSTGRCGTASA